MIVAFPGLIFFLPESYQTSGQGSRTVETKLFPVAGSDVRIESVTSRPGATPGLPPSRPAWRSGALSLLSFIL